MSDGTRKIMVSCTCPSINFSLRCQATKKLAHMLDSMVRVHNKAFSFHCAGKWKQLVKLAHVLPCLATCSHHAERTCLGIPVLASCLLEWSGPRRRDVFQSRLLLLVGLLLHVAKVLVGRIFSSVSSSFSSSHVFPRTQQAKKQCSHSLYSYRNDMIFRISALIELN